MSKQLKLEVSYRFFWVIEKKASFGAFETHLIIAAVSTVRKCRPTGEAPGKADRNGETNRKLNT